MEAGKEKLLMKYGFEGYGVYNYCCEIIAGALSTDNITFELEHDSELLAHKGKMDSKKIEEIMNYCVSQGLFEMGDNFKITWYKLLKLLDISTSNNPEFKKLLSNISNYQKLLETNSDFNSDTGKRDKQNYYKLLEPNSRIQENTIQENTIQELKYPDILIKNSWEKWKEYKKSQFKFSYKNHKYEQIAINSFIDKCDGDFNNAEKIVNRSIVNGWKGLFSLKEIPIIDNKNPKPGDGNKNWPEIQELIKAGKMNMQRVIRLKEMNYINEFEYNYLKGVSNAN
jgi:hypothetical protein